MCDCQSLLSECEEREAEGECNCLCKDGKDGFPESKVAGRFSKDQSEGEKAVKLMEGSKGKWKESTSMYSLEWTEMPGTWRIKNQTALRWRIRARHAEHTAIKTSNTLQEI